ncbi:MAG: carbonic anhydrase family protein [Oceanicaulis sp.]
MRFMLFTAASVLALSACGPDEAEIEAEDETMEGVEVANGGGVDDRNMGDDPADEFSADAETADAGYGEQDMAGGETGDVTGDATRSGDDQVGAEPASWSYEGEAGPANWADLDERYQVCETGNRQSPIDLGETPIETEETAAIRWNEAVNASIDGRGIAFKVTFEEAGGLMLGDEAYELIQMHFHAGSEHTAEGERYPLEAHFVHQSEGGDLAVVGVFFERGDPSPVLNAIIASLPDGPRVTDMDAALSLDMLLPEDRRAWRYEGSLTTPPCTEGVQWIVFETPATAAGEQIEEIAAYHPGNYRPIQSTGDREVRTGEAG